MYNIYMRYFNIRKTSPLYTYLMIRWVLFTHLCPTVIYQMCIATINYCNKIMYVIYGAVIYLFFRLNIYPLSQESTHGLWSFFYSLFLSHNMVTQTVLLPFNLMRTSFDCPPRGNSFHQDNCGPPEENRPPQSTGEESIRYFLLKSTIMLDFNRL